MIDWRRSYGATWRVHRVAVGTWADADPLAGVTSVSVERSCDGKAPLLESGSMDVDAAPRDGFSEGYYRASMYATQDGETERVDVCTLLCMSTEDNIDHGMSGVRVVGRSVLWPASKAYLPIGAYVPRGADGVAWANATLASAINAPIECMGGFVLDQHHVFGNSTTVLDAVWEVLRAGNHTMQISGDGTVSIMPLPSVPVLDLSQVNARLLHTGVHRALDLSDVPNVYTAVDGDTSAQAVNDDPTSPTSTVTRGWTSEVRDTSPKRIDGETLANYCARKLEEESTVWDTRSYTREWWPGVATDAIVRGTLDSVGLDGDLRVVSQGVTCGVGLTVEETVRREVRTWQRA